MNRRLAAALITALLIASSGESTAEISGSKVTFDSPAGGETCYAPGLPGTFCFRADSFTTNGEYVKNLWLKFPTAWSVSNVSVVGTPSCTGGGNFGTFSWSFVNFYEIKISHERWNFAPDNCSATYCVDVITAGTAGDNVSWYWEGDLYGATPHYPGSSNGYTPASMSSHPSDERINPPVAIDACPEAPLYVSPAKIQDSGCPGVSRTYDISFYNNTGSSGTFTITYSLAAGNAALSGPAQVALAETAAKTIQVVLEPDQCTLEGDNVTGQILIGGNGQTASVPLAFTMNLEPPWETIAFSAPAWAYKGWPHDGCTAKNAAGQWVTYLIGDLSGTGPTGFRGYVHGDNTWITLSSANKPADRWAPGWAYDSQTNLCYLTGGAGTPGAGTYAEAYVFDPVANAFTRLPDFTTVRDFHSSWVGRVDGVKYLCIGGGLNGSGEELASTQCYDLAGGAWAAEGATIGTLPAAVWGAADGVLRRQGGDQFWIVAGSTGGDESDAAYFWDDADNAWHGAGTTGFARFRVGGDFFRGDFYQVGGSLGGLTATAHVVRGRFDGTAWRWTRQPDLLHPRMDNVVAVTDTLWSVDGHADFVPDTSYVERLAVCPECPACVDADGDGYGENCNKGPDCDDTDPLVKPGMIDASCDGIDTDCDGAIDEDRAVDNRTFFYLDPDGDDYGIASSSIFACAGPAGYGAHPGDCNEADPLINPGMGDASCDGIDNDCSGSIDEDRALDNRTYFYRDMDADGYGIAAGSIFACTNPAGYAANPGDCNDNDAMYGQTCPDCTLKIFSARLGWLFGDNTNTRLLFISGEPGTDFRENSLVKWEADAFTVKKSRIFFKRFMIMRVQATSEPREDQQYRVLVGTCEGKITWTK